MIKKLISEFLGTFTLVFCGTGAIVLNQESGGQITNMGVALSFGLSVTLMILVFGKISGAHLNPAVSMAFALKKSITPRLLILYIASQVAGGLLASYIIHQAYPSNLFLGTTLPSGAPWISAILELFLTFILVMVILKMATGYKEKSTLGALLIGLTVMLEAFFAGPICGASMNPARSIAPALISGQLQYLWIYLLAPSLGALLAAGSFNYFKLR